LIVVVLTLIKTIDYRSGFIALAAIVALRLGVNLYADNVLEPEQFERFPFRA
jgi:hypothetical protein